MTWGILRNVPFVILGGIVCLLYYRKRTENRVFRRMWLYILLSFLFYIPVAVGAGAVNQAVKAIAISRGFLSPVGIEIACVPSFADIIIDGEYRTAIHFAIRAQYLHGTADVDDEFAPSLQN